MAHPCSPTIVRRHALGLALALLLVGLQPSFAGDSDAENAQLAMLIRQLDLIDRLAEKSEYLPREPDARYHFDYARMHEDVARIRAGIKDFLTPARAQPRDPNELLGQYRTESGEVP